MPLTKGKCPECFRWWWVRKDGLMALHRIPGYSWDYICAGSEKEPIVTSEPSQSPVGGKLR